jgi:hypothetical protein
MKFKLSKRNSPYPSRQKIAFQDDYYNVQEISVRDYEVLHSVLTSLRESGELEVNVSSLPDPPFSYELTLTLQNRKYYLRIACPTGLFEELWRVVVLRKEEISHLLIIKLLHFTKRLRWGRVEEDKEERMIVVSSETESAC